MLYDAVVHCSYSLVTFVVVVLLSAGTMDQCSDWLNCGWIQAEIIETGQFQFRFTRFDLFISN